MKNLCLILLFGLNITSWAGDVTVKIKGMTCQVCVKSITKQLKKLPQIEPKSILVSLEKNQAVFTEQSKVPDFKIELAIKKAGYQVQSIIR